MGLGSWNPALSSTEVSLHNHFMKICVGRIGHRCSNVNYHKSPEIYDTFYVMHQVMTWGTGDVETFWRESSQLPAARIALRATTVNDIIYLTGGEDEAWNAFTSILSWDPLTESWNEAGNLKMGRTYHAAVAITSSIIESECSA